MYIFLSFSLYISSLEVIINGEISRKRLNTQSLTCDVCRDVNLSIMKIFVYTLSIIIINKLW